MYLQALRVTPFIRWVILTIHYGTASTRRWLLKPTHHPSSRLVMYLGWGLHCEKFGHLNGSTESVVIRMKWSVEVKGLPMRSLRLVSQPGCQENDNLAKLYPSRKWVLFWSKVLVEKKKNIYLCMYVCILVKVSMLEHRQGWTYCNCLPSRKTLVQRFCLSAPGWMLEIIWQIRHVCLERPIISDSL